MESGGAVVAQVNEAAGSTLSAATIALEQWSLLQHWNETAFPYSTDFCLQQHFEAQVRRTPAAIAVVCADESVSYHALNERANRLAHWLRGQGAGPDVLVGMFAERSIAMVVGLLGILKAGAAYVALDPDFPSERTAFMLDDSQAPVLLTQQRLVPRLPAHVAKVLCLDADEDITALQPTTNPPNANGPDDLAYVVYTSGSTGRPKGTMNTHRGICNRLLWMLDTYPLGANERVLQKTPLSFDVSVWEIFWPLLAGACLVIARPGGHRESAYLRQVIIEERITTLHFVPSMLRPFLNEPDVEDCRSIRRIFCSGEALAYDLVQSCFAPFDIELHNLYGPAEAAIEVTYWHCRRDAPPGPVPIGRPIANTQIHILDEHLRPVPIGTTGELYIGGANLGRGYLNQPQLTAERFVGSPFANGAGERLYRTGDLARFRPDGAIDYLGRLDHQIKLYGVRVEPDEIERSLHSHPQVRQAAVAVHVDGSGYQRLVAYVVTNSGVAPAPADLRAHLRSLLPEVMVPVAFVFLDALPLTPSGKLDRQALPRPDFVHPERHTAALPPHTALEQQLVALWSGTRSRPLLRVSRW